MTVKIGVSAGVGQNAEGGLRHAGVSASEGSLQQGLVPRLQIRAQVSAWPEQEKKEAFHSSYTAH